MARHLSRALAFAVLSAAAVASAAAESIADPTRPPAAISGDGGADAYGPRLSSIMLPKNGRAAAVISGQLVPLGGKVGDARLVSVTETGVVLEGPDGVERLYLTPDVEKKIRVTKGAARRPKD